MADPQLVTSLPLVAGVPTGVSLNIAGDPVFVIEFKNARGTVDFANDRLAGVERFDGAVL
jgi:hypothetical protein